MKIDVEAEISVRAEVWGKEREHGKRERER